MLEEVRRRSFTFRTTATRIEKATLGNEAGLFGAACLPWVETPEARRIMCHEERWLNMWMGIDVGTGGTRALLVDAQGRVAAGSRRRMKTSAWSARCGPSSVPRTGGTPPSWPFAARWPQAGISGAQVRGIGLSGQMHGLVILDESSAVIRPALIWCDQRSQPQVDAINQTSAAKTS